jgi:N-sulfoglucosamine sulfohydrolase
VSVRPKLSRYKYNRRFENEHPTLVLANTDDGPSEDFLANGWAELEIPQEQLYDLLFDPNEAHNLAENPQHAGVLEEMNRRPKKWM